MSVGSIITQMHFLVLLCIVNLMCEQLPKYVNTQWPELGNKEKFTLVSLHNKLRGNVRPPAANMRKMVWNEALGSQAHIVASSCQENAPDDPQVGWNLQSFPAGTMTLTDAINLWFRQGYKFNVWTSKCAQNQTCHHYTQLVWASSSQMGCGMSRCTLEIGEVDMIVCAYIPGGNWHIGGHIIRPYYPGPWCSLCTASYSGCFTSWEHRGGLCEIPKNPCRMSCGDHGKLNTSICQCDCDRGYTGHLCQVRCGSYCLHGQYKAAECSCVCNTGYKGTDCTEVLTSSALHCDLLSDGVCFMVSSEHRSYYKAKKICREGGGSLAEIRTQKTQDILAFFLGQLKHKNELREQDFKSRNFWIGLTYKRRFLSFRWDSGNHVSFQSFALGQPDNVGSCNCVEMNAHSQFNWNDQRCKIHNRYICQYKNKIA